MARAFHPAIEELARKRHLGTPEQLYDYSGSVQFLWFFIIILSLLELYGVLSFLVPPFTNRPHIDLGSVVLELIGLGLIALCIYGIRHSRPGSEGPYYCRCTEGFLELTSDDPPKVIHALRWDDVTSTRRVQRWAVRGWPKEYYVSTRHGKEIQIRDSGIWDYCNEQVYLRTGNLS